MKYQCIDGTVHGSRKEVRSYCRSIRLGKDVKENYIQIAENSCDDSSIKKGYSCIEGSISSIKHSKSAKAWNGDYYKNYYKPKLKRFKK